MKYTNTEVTEEKIRETAKKLEKIKKALLSGTNQKKLTLAEEMLLKRRKELEKEIKAEYEKLETKKENIHIKISQLENAAITLRERLALLSDEYGRAREQSRITADKIIKLETEYGHCRNEIREKCHNDSKSLALRLKEEKDKAESINKDMNRIRQQLEDVQYDTKKQREELNVLEAYRPFAIEADRQYMALEKEFACRTARRDYLLDRYSAELKKLDRLNCRLYGMRLAEKSSKAAAELKNISETRKEEKYV